VTNYMVPAGFALQIRQNPAPAGFLKSKSGTALLTVTRMYNWSPLCTYDTGQFIIVSQQAPHYTT